ncbi:MAG: peptide-methionine (S)-S-oxide reductase MsrA [Candidatus Brocadiaceae bacterium]|nr:peptide-methionine (S)-S-oxide reductase MsrA [Candidatus Brocadiaceae bacterium]
MREAARKCKRPLLEQVVSGGWKRRFAVLKESFLQPSVTLEAHLKIQHIKTCVPEKRGHAEVVEVEYDPSIISYEGLLEVFWKCHNPTTLNRQGPDIGTQYRSAIFYHNDQQKALAIASRDKIQKAGLHIDPLVTEIKSASTFYRAEEYHQQYLEKNGFLHCK